MDSLAQVTVNKMKLALAFLLVFVTTSYQQHQYQKRLLPWMPAPVPAARAYYNNFYPSYYNNDEDVLPRQHFQPAPAADVYVVEPSSFQDDEEEDYEEDPETISPSLLYGEIERPSFRQQQYQPVSYYDQPHRSPNHRFWYLPEDYAIQSRNKFYPSFYHHQPEEAYLPHWADQIESRRRGPIGRPAKVPIRQQQPGKANNDDAAQQRFFLNLLGGNKQEIVISTSSSAFRLPFGKTRGVVVTSAVNLTTVASCVDRSEFVTANPTACRRRRRGVERLLSFDDQLDDTLSPSHVEKLETTALSPLQIYEERNARFHEFLASSKDDLVLDDEDEIDRGKRSFFNLGATITLTSYTFYNTTITKTVRLLTAGTTSGLTCLPCNFVTC